MLDYLLAGLLGLVAGYLLNRRVDLDAPPERRLLPAGLARLVGGRSLLSLLVLSLAVAMALLLADYYGLSPRFALLYAASLVLIHTGAVDWRLRLIDTLVLVIATVVTLAAAPVGVGWPQALRGVLGATVAFLVLYIVARVIFPGHAAPFGLGDVYLGAFIGALMGINQLPAALFYGMLLAGLVSLGIILARTAGRETPVYISYGSFLCLGTLIYMLLWPFK